MKFKHLLLICASALLVMGCTQKQNSNKPDDGEQTQPGGGEQGGKQVSEEEKLAAEKALKSALYIGDDKLENIKVMISVLVADGWTEAAISGMIGNSYGESGLNPKSYTYDTSNGTCNGGAFGFTPIKNYIDDKGHWKGTENTCTHELFTFGDSGKEQVRACPQMSCQMVCKLSLLDSKLITEFFNGLKIIK